MRKTLQILTLSALLGVIPFVPHHTAVQANGPEITKATTINVTGMAERKIAPDYALLSLGSEAKGSSAAEAKRKSDATMSALISQLNNLGIAKTDIQTSNFNIYPEYTNDGKVANYVVDNTITVKIKDTNQISTTIDSAARAGATSINSLSFGSDRTDEYDDTMTLDAIKDARHKADIIAGALGMTIDNVENVQTSNAYTRPASNEGVMFKLGSARTSTPIEEGNLIVQKSVFVTYRLK